MPFPRAKSAWKAACDLTIAGKGARASRSSRKSSMAHLRTPRLKSKAICYRPPIPGRREQSGDLHLGVLYNFNTETLNIPAMAVRVEADLPTGVNSKGVDTQLTGILTRSFGRLRAHLNLGYSLLGSPQGQERSGAYRAVAAVSYPLGYPTSFRDTLIASIYSRQSGLRGQRNHTGVEIGLRHQLTSRVVLDGGLGTEFLGPSDRAALLGTVGVSVGF